MCHFSLLMYAVYPGALRYFCISPLTSLNVSLCASVFEFLTSGPLQWLCTKFSQCTPHCMHAAGFPTYVLAHDWKLFLFAVHSSVFLVSLSGRFVLSSEVFSHLLVVSKANCPVSSLLIFSGHSYASSLNIPASWQLCIAASVIWAAVLFPAGSQHDWTSFCLSVN